MSEPDVQRATPGDAEGIMHLLVACRQDMLARGIRQWVEQYPTAAVVEEAMADTFVIRLEGRIAATAALNERAGSAYERVRWLTPLRQPALIVHRLAVHPDFQRRGLARRLMRFAEEYAARRGLASIRLDAFSGNPSALALYDRVGYTRVGQVFFPHRDLPFICFEKVLGTG
jgi:ribosomal protein S18 acetylase RimI-like enzyme